MRRHGVADINQLVEDEATGQKSYRYVRTGTDHYSLAFTYDCIAWSTEQSSGIEVCDIGYNEDESMRNNLLVVDM